VAPADIQLIVADKDEEKVSGDVPSASNEGAAALLEEMAMKESVKSEGTADMAVQTGEKQLEVTKNAVTGEMEKATVYVDGKAQGEGSVVVTADGKEHVSGGSVVKDAPV